MVHEAKSILVPVDETEQSKSALVPARALAAAFGARVYILHVSERQLSYDELLGRLDLEQAEAREAILRQATGEPATEIVSQARSLAAGLIVMATRGPAIEAERPSITAKVLKRAHCPVLVTRREIVERRRAQGRVGSFRRILVPLDGSPRSAAAIRAAAGLLPGEGTELIVLHIATYGQPALFEPGSLTIPQYMDQPQHEWPAWSEEFIKRFLGAVGPLPAGLRIHFQVALGRPARKIIRAAERWDVDLIITAWHGRLERGRAAVVKKLLVDSPAPLLFVHSEGS